MTDTSALFPGAAALGFDDVRDNGTYIDYVRYQTHGGIEFNQQVTLDVEDNIWYGTISYYDAERDQNEELPRESNLNDRTDSDRHPSPFDVLKWIDAFDYAGTVKRIQEAK